MANMVSYQEFEDFLKKYDLDIVDEKFAMLKIKKDEFNKETLMNSIKGLVCEGYVKNSLKDTL